MVKEERHNAEGKKTKSKTKQWEAKRSWSQER